MANTSLQEFVESVNGTSRLRIEEDFGDGFVRLMTSEAERRQAAQDIRSSEDIVLELLRNARDAHATHIFVATSREGANRLLTVIDDGDGIPTAMQQLVFEPRVTSKLDTSHSDAWGYHGRGMALYSISVNAEEAYVADSAPGLGTALHVRTNTTSLPERTDQSTFPTFDVVEKGKVNVRGPRNLLRTICEFALDCRSSCIVYVGTPAEICSALYTYGMATLSTIDRLFCDAPHQLPLSKRLATASDPYSLMSLASSFGLSISERTARRVIDGQVEPANSILDRITLISSAQNEAKSQPRKPRLDQRSIRLSKEDKSEIAEAARIAYSAIAERHFLDSSVEPQVTVKNNRLLVSIPLIHD